MQVAQITRQEMSLRNLILATSIFFVSLVLGTLTGQDTTEELMKQLGAVLEPLAGIDG
jgi:hypothetical protein